VGDEPVELDEAPFVQEQVEPLAGGELALLVLLSYARRTTTLLGFGLAVVQLFEQFTGIGHGAGI
jgi:hypothetical protein